jgi:hypothetical protein
LGRHRRHGELLVAGWISYRRISLFANLRVESFWRPQRGTHLIKSFRKKRSICRCKRF